MEEQDAAGREKSKTSANQKQEREPTGRPRERSKKEWSGWSDLNMNGLGNLGQHFRYCKISFKDDNKYNVNPFEVEETIRKATGKLPIELFSINKYSFIAKVDGPNVDREMTQITNIEGTPCDTAPYKLFNTCRGYPGV